MQSFKYFLLGIIRYIKQITNEKYLRIEMPNLSNESVVYEGNVEQSLLEMPHEFFEPYKKLYSFNFSMSVEGDKIRVDIDFLPFNERDIEGIAIWFFVPISEYQTEQITKLFLMVKWMFDNFMAVKDNK